MNILQHIRQFGQQIWLDNLSRALVRDGILARLVAEGVSGVTTNPAIFHKALADGRYYREELDALKHSSLDPEARYERLVVADVQAACDMLMPVFERSEGSEGYVSLEVSPMLAQDAAGTVAAGKRLAEAVSRANLLIKVPATGAGVEAIETLLAEGINVNVTLMFSRRHVEAVARAYIRGLERLRDRGGHVEGAMSVASLFLSRVDTLVDRQLEALGDASLPCRGKSGVALAKLAYRDSRALFDGEIFAPLAAAGARAQRMLWASTGTKNPAYSDLLYVEPLIGRDTINTLPDGTLAALLDHGRAEESLECDIEAARSHIDALAGFGIDLDQLGEQLQRDGLEQFETAFAALLDLMR